jgi:hypothetical protein
MTEHSILLLGTNADIKATLEYATVDRQCRIVLRYGDETLQASATDFFAAFCKVREQLEQKGFKPQCYGASLNVYPSAMGRDMAEGLKAYRLTMGKHAKDLVYIFDNGPDVSPATVEEQKKFFDTWRTSKRT